MAAEYLVRMGQRMKERREELDLSQEDVARKLPGKTTGNQISRWERGLHRPSDDALERLAEVLGVQVSYFLAPAPDKTETPDLVAVMANGSRSQLDRIESLLQDNAAALERVASTLGERVAELNRRLDDLTEAATWRIATDVDRTVGRDAEPGDVDTRDQPG